MTTGRFVPVLLGAGRPTSSYPIDGRIEVAQGRFRNRRGWWPWRSVSDFTALYYVQHGLESVIANRFDAYAADGRTMVRVFGNLNWPWFGIAIDWRSGDYWSSLERLAVLANERGLYLELNCYGAAEFFASDADYRTATRDYAEFTKEPEGVFLRLANEPYKNGWTNADDPRLLELADLTASILGHRDFAVGDAGDGNIPVLQTVAQHCNVAMVHPDRSEPQDGRYRRWVDHLKSSAEMLEHLPASTAMVFDEPMGAGVRQEGRRDDDPDAHLAAMLVSEFCETGYTYHWIPEELAFKATALPGMAGFAQVKDQLPVSPDWNFSNSTPVATIEWAGLTGKTRNSLNGQKGWTVAYGEADWSTLGFSPGWVPTEVFAGPRIRVVKTNQ